jgi:hypothetical protein
MNKKNQKILILIILFLSSSCKKEHICECKSIYKITYKTIKNTKTKARQECEATLVTGLGSCKLNTN